MQAHVGGVIKGLVKENSKYALNELLASRAPDISRKLASISWNARVGIVLIDEARLRAWFGARVDRWKAARDALIGEDGKKVFSAKILEEVGLS